jgi:hypothetical protein
MFVLPHLWYYRDPLYDYTDDLSRNAGRWLFSHRAVRLLKHVSVSLCTRTEIPLTMTYSDWNKHEESDPGAFDRLSTVERMTQAHEMRTVLWAVVACWISTWVRWILRSRGVQGCLD